MPGEKPLKYRRSQQGGILPHVKRQQQIGLGFLGVKTRACKITKVDLASCTLVLEDKQKRTILMQYNSTEENQCNH